jgi:hypothetical protein
MYLRNHFGTCLSILPTATRNWNLFGPTIIMWHSLKKKQYYGSRTLFCQKSHNTLQKGEFPQYIAKNPTMHCENLNNVKVSSFITS